MPETSGEQLLSLYLDIKARLRAAEETPEVIEYKALLTDLEASEQALRLYVKESGEPLEFKDGNDVFRLSRRMDVRYDEEAIKQRFPALYLQCLNNRFSVAAAKKHPELNELAEIFYTTFLTKHADTTDSGRQG